MRRLDIVLVIDPRFSGGTASALLADLDAFLAQGAVVGLCLVRSDFFKGSDDAPHPAVMASADHPQVHLIASQETVHCELAFFHHPLTFAYPTAETVKIIAQKAVIVAHHPCFRGDGSLEYNPLRVSHRVHKHFGTAHMWAPISGLIRAQLRTFCPLIRLTNEDWGNMFDPSQWQATRPIFDGERPVLGRHGRPDRLKWPDTAGALQNSLDGGPDWSVRIMGWPDEGFPFDIEASHGWEILKFNDEPVPSFLESLDVFTYHHSNLWVEAYGRTVVEAMLMGRPCLLDPRLKVTFGDLAAYCFPEDVPGQLDKLRSDAAATRQRCVQVRSTIAKQVSSEAMPKRLTALRSDDGIRSRRGQKAASAATAVRKSLGLARRDWSQSKVSDASSQ